MIHQHYTIEGKQFYSVSFGLEDIGKLKDGLSKLDVSIDAITLAFSHEQTGRSNLQKEEDYPLSGVPLERMGEYAEGKEPALFRLTGSTIDLVLVQQRQWGREHFENVFVKKYTLSGPTREKVVHEGQNAVWNQDSVYVNLGLDPETYNAKNISEIRDTIRSSCRFGVDEIGKNKYETLKAADSEENTIEEFNLKQLLQK